MKKCAAFLTSFFLLFSMFGFKAEAAQVTDLDASNRFYEEISYLVHKNVISGYPDGRFKPDQVVTRGEAAIMIGRALNLNGAKRNSKFKDVYKNTAASGYIASAVEKGIISGYPNQTFKPDAAISRGDMAIILSRAFNLYSTSAYGFKDVGEQMSAYEPVRKISLASISVGYPDGTYRPQLNVTRAQFSAFLARGMEIKFKQKASIENSYAMDKTKQYTYKMSDGNHLVLTFKDIGMKWGENLGYLWEVYVTKTKEVDHFYEDESYDGLNTGYPMSEYYVNLVYPIKVGNKWSVYYDEEVEEITAVNKTVTTPYKTFTNAVEVTGAGGYKSYYVKNIGHVKSIDEKGKVYSELINMN